MKKLIIIPAYNEATSLAAVLREIACQCPEYDIVVINDGSRDETSAVCQHAGIDVLDLPFNLGIGGAVQTGYRYGMQYEYDVVIQMDGDGQHDPAFLEQLVAPILSGEVDMVIGSRFLRKEGFQSSFWRRLGIRFYTVLIRQVTGKTYSDPTSGFRAVSKELVHYFSCEYPVDFPEPESIVTLTRLQYRIRELPVRMRQRQEGKSSISGLKVLYYMTKVTLAIFMHYLSREEHGKCKL